MSFFFKFYNFFLSLAKHRLAVYALAFLSYIESFILPYPPPDVMLVPMVLKNSKKAINFAAITTLFSLLGGITGYVIGYFAYDLISSYLNVDKLDIVKEWFNIYGIWIIIIAGFSPIPYKIFTIMAGFLVMPIIPFILCSLLGRGGRFFLVALLSAKYGYYIDKWIKQYIDYIGYLLIAIVVLYILW